MLIKGIDIGKYIQTFDVLHLSSVLQFLEVFKWDNEAEDWLREHLLAGHDPPDESDDVDKYDVSQLKGPGVVIGQHDCGGKILRWKIRGCHTTATGRSVYEECTNCSYYREEFRHGTR